MSKTVKILLYLIAVFLSQEILFRFLFPLPEISNLQRSNYMPQIFDATAVETVPYEKRSWASYPDTLHDFIHHMNGYGFRDDEWLIQKSPGKKRILMVGDSFVEGAMVNQESTIPAVIERLMGEDEVEVMNAGIIGIGMEEYAKLITDLTPVFKPDQVILVVYANDISGRPFNNPEFGLDVSVLNWFEPRLYTLIVRLSENQALHNRQQKVKPFIPKQATAWIKNEPFIRSRVTEMIANFMHAGKFNVYRTNWVLIEEANLKKPFRIKAHLTYLNDYVSSFGSKLVVVYVPSRHQVSTYYYQFERDMCRLECPPELDMTSDEYQVPRLLLKQDCSTLGIPFIDTYYQIRTMEQQGTHVYWNYDDHMRKVGYELVARTIVEDLVDNPISE